MVCESESIFNTFYPVTATNTTGKGKCELTYYNKVNGTDIDRECKNSEWETAKNDVCIKYEFPKITIDFTEVKSIFIDSGDDKGKIRYSGNIILNSDTCDKSLLPKMFVFIKFDTKPVDKFDGITPTPVTYCFPDNKISVVIPQQDAAYNYYYVTVGVYGTPSMTDLVKIDSFSIYYYHYIYWIDIECDAPVEYNIDWDITIKGIGYGKCVEFYKWIGTTAQPTRECLGNNEYTTNDQTNCIAFSIYFYIIYIWIVPDINIELKLTWDDLYNKITSGNYIITYPTCDSKNTYPLTYKVTYKFDNGKSQTLTDIPSCTNPMEINNTISNVVTNKQSTMTFLFYKKDGKEIFYQKTIQLVCEEIITNNITWGRIPVGQTRTYDDFACKPFFEFEGSNPKISRKCLSDGTWEESTYICKYEGVSIFIYYYLL